ncbi:MAG: zinc-dependent metalloprotease [Bdellovibrionaceae bacterium]|nr:zinc-dependent metalloprotease [Bdellovibrio sp.]
MFTKLFNNTDLINKGFKMGKMKMTKQNLIFAVFGLMILASCTKSVPYKEADPNTKGDQLVDKTIVSDKDSVLLLATSMQAASRSSKDALPYSSGENKRVKLEVTEKFLRVIETEPDPRFAANSTNDKLVLQIPIAHVQFQCAKDKFGECTNTEEEAKDIPWNQKNQIRVKFDETVSGQLDILPIMISQTEGENCYDLVSARLINSSITKEAINFQIERTFKTKMNCLKELNQLSDATVTAVFHYSMVRLESVLSKDFKVVSYPRGSEDENSFGFFSSTRTVLDKDNNNSEKSAVQVMNHWNPNREEIVYYLSDEFAKPENKVVKDLTYKTVDNINKGLEIAGVKFRINLQEPAGKVSGDIRNSMIVLVEDPVESNIIGYGPQTEDPLTGEIISARTVMFLGTIKKFIKNTYEEIRMHKSEANAARALVKPQVTLSESLVANLNMKKQSQLMAGPANLEALVAKNVSGKKAAKPIAAPAINKETVSPKALIAKLSRQVNPEMTGTDVVSRLKYQLHAKNCAFEPSTENFSDGISKKLMDSISDQALPWDQLDEKAQAEMIAIILPEIWVPTLIHEMGHNLGLRHNFKASADKENFLTKDELQKNNIDHDIPFSSVMDYGNDLKALPVLGKYDIAALKFGYLRQVEIQDVELNSENDDKKVLQKKMVIITTTLDALMAPYKPKPGALKITEVKPYGYCTDDHLGINADCKQFDLGSSLTEMTQNAIKDYEAAYKTRNLRGGRASMSLMDDPSYAARMMSTFKNLRILMELTERINKTYGADSNLWQTHPYLIDLKQATLLAGTFLVKVLLVPDVTCAVGMKEKPSEITQLINIANISDRALSCFEIDLNPKYVMIGQTGKFLNSKKDPKSTNPYLDQIDVRGIWADKVAAARMLLNRKIGIFSMDAFGHDSFINMPDMKEDIQSILIALMQNNIVASLPFTLADGSVLPLEVHYDLFSDQVIETPLVLAAMDERGTPPAAKKAAADHLGVNANGKTQLQEVILKVIANEMVDTSGEHEQDKAFALKFEVEKFNANFNAQLTKDVHTIVINGTRFAASEANKIAFDAIEDYQASTLLSTLERDKVIEIYVAKEEEKAMPETATEVEKKVWELNKEILKNFLIGVIQEPQFYSRLLNIL